MLIELNDDFYGYIKNIKDYCDDTLILVEKLFALMAESKHIVFLSREILKEVGNNPFFSARSKLCAGNIYKNYPTIYSIIHDSSLLFKIVITPTGKYHYSLNDGKTYFYVPMSVVKHNSFSCLNTALLCTENSTDASLFMDLSCYILKKLKPQYNGKVSINLKNIPFYGGNVGNAIQNNLINQEFAIYIVDSDKYYEKDAFGDTYKNAKQCFDKYKNSYVMHLYALKVREKENLFTPSIYYYFVSEQKKTLMHKLEMFQTDELFARYFNLKDVIKKDILDDLLANDDTCLLYSSLISRGILKKDCDNSAVAIGDKVCTYVDQCLLQNEDAMKKTITSMKYDYGDIIGLRKSDFFGSLPQPISEEWHNLFELMFTWGLCLKTDLVR